MATAPIAPSAPASAAPAPSYVYAYASGACTQAPLSLTTAQMTIYYEKAACFNGFSGKEVRTRTLPLKP